MLAGDGWWMGRQPTWVLLAPPPLVALAGRGGAAWRPPGHRCCRGGTRWLGGRHGRPDELACLTPPPHPQQWQGGWPPAGGKPDAHNVGGLQVLVELRLWHAESPQRGRRGDHGICSQRRAHVGRAAEGRAGGGRGSVGDTQLQRLQLSAGPQPNLATRLTVGVAGPTPQELGETHAAECVTP